MAGKTYSIEYKIQAVKRVTEDGKTASQVSKELGINVNTLREWVKRYREDLMIINETGQTIRTGVKDIRLMGRTCRHSRGGSAHPYS